MNTSCTTCVRILVSQIQLGSFRTREMRVHTLKNIFVCLNVFRQTNSEAVFNIPYRNVKGVWWMPRL